MVSLGALFPNSFASCYERLERQQARGPSGMMVMELPFGTDFNASANNLRTACLPIRGRIWSTELVRRSPQLLDLLLEFAGLPGVKCDLTTRFLQKRYPNSVAQHVEQEYILCVVDVRISNSTG